MTEGAVCQILTAHGLERPVADTRLNVWSSVPIPRPKYVIFASISADVFIVKKFARVVHNVVVVSPG